ncbi:MAG: hypothetical protein IPG76_15420 [Acidobacteria bacterium]|nr:hypothetical protein [Acidobacteriota bacterium]
MLILNRVVGDFTSSAATIDNITGLVYDDREIAYRYTQIDRKLPVERVLSNTFPRTFTPFGRVIPAGGALRLDEDLQRWNG